jgi:hypothetical protein
VKTAWLCLALAACTPRAGDSCERGAGACKDRSTALRCSDGKLIEVPCKGPAGCGIAANVMTCDFSADAPGDACSTDAEGESLCTTDRKASLTCRGGKLVREECEGDAQCVIQAGSVLCAILTTEQPPP